MFIQKDKKIKHLAILFYGHLRTFDRTFDSLKQNVLIPNSNDDYQIDIFMHTWNVLEAPLSGHSTWHGENSKLAGKPLSDKDIEYIKNKYQPTALIIDNAVADKKLVLESQTSVKNLYEKYRKEHNINYDFVLVTRPDIFFARPLVIDDYVNWYRGNQPKEFEVLKIKLPEKVIFAGGSGFNFINIADPRFIGEADLLYFTKGDTLPNDINQDMVTGGYTNIRINYILNKDFFMCRANKLGTRDRHFRKYCKVRTKPTLLRRIISMLIPFKRLRQDFRSGLI